MGLEFGHEEFKTVTAKQLADAIKKNGIAWGKGTFFLDEVGDFIVTPYKPTNSAKIAQACALGIGAINLGIEPSFYIEVEQEHIEEDEDHINCTFLVLNDAIAEYNDDVATSWEDVARYAIQLLEEYPDATFKAKPFDYTGKVQFLPPKIIDGQLDLFGPE